MDEVGKASALRVENSVPGAGTVWWSGGQFVSLNILSLSASGTENTSLHCDDCDDCDHGSPYWPPLEKYLHLADRKNVMIGELIM